MCRLKISTHPDQTGVHRQCPAVHTARHGPKPGSRTRSRSLQSALQSQCSLHAAQAARTLQVHSSSIWADFDLDLDPYRNRTNISDISCSKNIGYRLEITDMQSLPRTSDKQQTMSPTLFLHTHLNSFFI